MGGTLYVGGVDRFSNVNTTTGRRVNNIISKIYKRLDCELVQDSFLIKNKDLTEIQKSSINIKEKKRLKQLYNAEKFITYSIDYNLSESEVNLEIQFRNFDNESTGIAKVNFDQYLTESLIESKITKSILDVLELEKSIPIFELPPHQWSANASINITKKNFIKIADINEEICKALDNLGYDERRYFSTPNGFALVTRIEQINEDATINHNKRWEVKTKHGLVFLVNNYIQALVGKNPGLYRVFVFVITDKPIKKPETKESLSKEQIFSWYKSGSLDFPKTIGKILVTENHFFNILVYEFLQPESGEQATLKTPCSHTGKMHLEQSNLWHYFYD